MPLQELDLTDIRRTKEDIIYLKKEMRRCALTEDKENLDKYSQELNDLLRQKANYRCKWVIAARKPAKVKLGVKDINLKIDGSKYKNIFE